jgi:hypothetical protein
MGRFNHENLFRMVGDKLNDLQIPNFGTFNTSFQIFKILLKMPAVWFAALHNSLPFESLPRKTLIWARMNRNPEMHIVNFESEIAEPASLRRWFDGLNRGWTSP